jgi:hypothetical protein
MTVLQPEPQSQESAVLVSTPSVSGDEELLDRALNYMPLKRLTDPEPLYQVLRLIMLKVGLRPANLPAPEEKAILVAHIIKYYGQHTVPEISLAFDMAINGKLSCDVELYENFSVKYFASIMNAYRKWAEGVLPFLPSHSKTPAPVSAPVHSNWREIIESEYQNFLADKPILWNLWPLGFYDQVVFDGFVETDAYNDYAEHARTRICTELQKDIFSELHSPNGSRSRLREMENKLKEIKSGTREHEVAIVAKALTVRLLFRLAKRARRPALYERC